MKIYYTYIPYEDILILYTFFFICSVSNLNVKLKIQFRQLYENANGNDKMCYALGTLL